MSESVLTFTQLEKHFDAIPVLRGISTTVQRGEVIGLLGLNGAGKTTLLETALGFSLPSGGACRLFGDVEAQLMDEDTKARIGFVPQQDELLEGSTGKQYMQLISDFYRHWNTTLIERLSREWQVPLDRKIRTLSQGQRQKLSILSALGHEPELIVLDEPVASLDPVARRQFLKELVDIASTHTRTIIFSTHIVSDLERIASRVWLMKDGRIVIDEELDQLKERCARVLLPPGMQVPAMTESSTLLHARREQNSTTLIFSDWSRARKQALEQDCGIPLEAEALSLEDIFLEMHA